MTVAPIGTNEVDGIRTCNNCYRKVYVHNGFGLGTYCATLPEPRKVSDWTVCHHNFSIHDTLEQQADIVMRTLDREDFEANVFKRYGKAKDFQPKVDEEKQEQPLGFDY